MTLPEVQARGGNYTTMANYQKVPSINGMMKSGHNRNATPILSSVREQGLKNNFMKINGDNSMNKTARGSDYNDGMMVTGQSPRKTFQSPGRHE
jgi:hypothetical protein